MAPLAVGVCVSLYSSSLLQMLDRESPVESLLNSYLKKVLK